MITGNFRVRSVRHEAPSHWLAPPRSAASARWHRRAVAGRLRSTVQHRLVPKALEAGERISKSVHHFITPRRAMAQEFSEADLSPQFRSNGTALPDNQEYQALALSGLPIGA